MALRSLENFELKVIQTFYTYFIIILTYFTNLSRHKKQNSAQGEVQNVCDQSQT